MKIQKFYSHTINIVMHGVISNISIAGFKIVSLKSRQLRQKMHQYPAQETITITLQSFQYTIMA